MKRSKSVRAENESVPFFSFDFLYGDSTGLPESDYSVDDIKALTENIFRHVYQAYPTVPSPIYGH